MYYPNDIEEICYEQAHIEQVLDEIRQVLPAYFQEFIDTEGGNAITDESIIKLSEVFGSSIKPKSKAKDPKIVLNRLLKESVEDFESDRAIYKEILDAESLMEYKHDVSSFKNTILRNQVPIIRKTLQSKNAKELDKYRAAFKDAQPGNLFEVVNNIITLADEWRNNWYEAETFESIQTCDDLDYFQLDGEGYAAFGVIGGGIKSHFIYKLYPEIFPNRNREAVWALWFLTNKKKFGCKEDSEFLMIDQEAGTTQQNYFYPYALFAFYALQIFNMLKVKYAKYGISLPTEYRFVPVNQFLSFVARKHQAETDVLKQNAQNYHYDY